MRSGAIVVATAAALIIACGHMEATPRLKEAQTAYDKAAQGPAAQYSRASSPKAREPRRVPRRALQARLQTARRRALAAHDDGALQGAKESAAPSITCARVDYPLLGKTIRVTDDVDVSLVKPRPRRYETAGAASTAAKGTDETRSPKSKSAPAAE